MEEDRGVWTVSVSELNGLMGLAGGNQGYKLCTVPVYGVHTVSTKYSQARGGNGWKDGKSGNVEKVKKVGKKRDPPGRSRLCRLSLCVCVFVCRLRLLERLGTVPHPLACAAAAAPPPLSSTSSYEQPSSLPLSLSSSTRLASLFYSLSLHASPLLLAVSLSTHSPSTPPSLVRPPTYLSHLSFDQRETCLAAHPHCFLLTIFESQSPIKTRRETLLPRLLPFCSDPILQPRGSTSQRELRTPAAPSRQHLKHLNYLRHSPNYQLPGYLLWPFLSFQPPTLVTSPRFCTMASVACI